MLKGIMNLLILIGSLLPNNVEPKLQHNNNCYERTIEVIRIVDRSGMNPPTPNTIMIHEELVCNGFLKKRKSYSKKSEQHGKYRLGLDTPLLGDFSIHYNFDISEVDHSDETKTNLNLVAKAIQKIYSHSNSISNTDLNISYSIANDSLKLILNPSLDKSIWHLEQVNKREILMTRKRIYMPTHLSPEESRTVHYDEHGTIIEDPKTKVTYEYDDQNRIKKVISTTTNINHTLTNITVEKREYI